MGKMGKNFGTSKNDHNQIVLTEYQIISISDTNIKSFTQAHLLLQINNFKY